ncbi:hypothetical protein DSECCO2_598800 [anaerobic digester metagenome]
MQQNFLQCLNTIIQRCREKQILAGLGKQRKNLVHFVLKTSGQHFVRLIKNQHLYRRQRDCVEGYQLQQSARSGNKNAYIVHSHHLRIDRHPAKDSQGLYRQSSFIYVRGKHGMNLSSKLSGGNQYQSLDMPALHNHFLFLYMHKDGQYIAKGLARPCLGNTKHIPLVQDCWNYFCLNWIGRCDMFFL